jgi:hypothetical protein
MRRLWAVAGALVLGAGLTGTSLAGRPGAPPSDGADLAAAIDAALERAWKRDGLAPAATVSDLAFQRRLWLDLLGTLPSLEEIRDLEREPEAGRKARLVTRALADARFGETLAERLAKIAVGAGKKPDDLFYRRRRFVEWLRDQVNERRGWDEIVRELIASEGFSTGAPAVNFVLAQDADPAKLAGRTARAFLGVRIDCAQCHDHPFAPWKQGDFEGIAAFFARTARKGPFLHEESHGDYDIEDRKDGTFRRVEPHVPFSRNALPPLDVARPAPSPKRRAALARWVTDPGNAYFARAISNRAWAWLLGRGIVDPVDELDQQEPSNPEVLELLERDLRDHRFDLVRLVRAIVSTRAYALASTLDAGRAAEADRLRASFALYPLKPLHPDQLANAIWQATAFQTQDDARPLLFRIARADQTKKFVERHGGDLDAEVPEDETLFQRYLLMNGALVKERTKADNPFGVPARLVLLAHSDETVVETAYLMALSRRPTASELEHFRRRLGGLDRPGKTRAAQDLLWALINSVEFAWNH